MKSSASLLTSGSGEIAGRRGSRYEPTAIQTTTEANPFFSYPMGKLKDGFFRSLQIAGLAARDVGTRMLASGRVAVAADGSAPSHHTTLVVREMQLVSASSFGCHRR
jgi:hypothetical protein